MHTLTLIIYKQDDTRVTQNSVVSIDFDIDNNLLVVMLDTHEFFTINMSLVKKFYTFVPVV